MAAWLAYFDAEALAWKTRERESISRSLALKYETHSRPVAVPTVFEPEHEIDSDSGQMPRGVGGLVDFAQAFGWSARVVASLAAHPDKGMVDVVSLRCRRRDERIAAVWWNRSFETAWYVGPPGLERLGMRRLAPGKVAKVRGVADALEGIRLVDASLALAVPSAHG